MNISIHELQRDEDLAVLGKKVSILDLPSFETPTKSIKGGPTSGSSSVSSLLVNEIVRRVDQRALESLEEGGASRVTREIQSQFVLGKLNLVIFNLAVDQVPERPLMRTFAQQLSASSERSIFLPAVKASLYKELTAGRRNMKFSETRFEKYVLMMRNLIEDIQAVGNNKAFFGTIPLVPIKFARQLIGLYLSKGITCFAIDANTSDPLLHETDLRAILSEINQGIPLSEALIYACNLGFPRYEASKARADDFLSVFAYIDILGNTFKQKAIKQPPPGFPRREIKPRFKVFSRDDYSYHLLEKSPNPQSILNARNQREQLIEAHLVRDMIGQERIRRYIETKSAVDGFVMGKLYSIANTVKVV